MLYVHRRVCSIVQKQVGENVHLWSAYYIKVLCLVVYICYVTSFSPLINLSLWKLKHYWGYKIVNGKAKIQSLTFEFNIYALFFQSTLLPLRVYESFIADYHISCKLNQRTCITKVYKLQMFHKSG